MHLNLSDRCRNLKRDRLNKMVKSEVEYVFEVMASVMRSKRQKAFAANNKTKMKSANRVAWLGSEQVGIIWLKWPFEPETQGG